MTDFKFSGGGSGLDRAVKALERATHDDIRIAIMNAFLRAFPQADSREVLIVEVETLPISFEIDWIDPKRDSIAPRTFDVIVVKNGDRVSYAFQEV